MSDLNLFLNLDNRQSEPEKADVREYWGLYLFDLFRKEKVGHIYDNHPLKGLRFDTLGNVGESSEMHNSLKSFSFDSMLCLLE